MKVFWNAEEKASIAARVKELIDLGQFVSWSDAIKRAQAVLPKHRQRELSSPSGPAALAIRRIVDESQTKKQKAVIAEPKVPVPVPVPVSNIELSVPNIVQGSSMVEDSLKQIAKTMAEMLEGYLAEEMERVAERAFALAIKSIQDKTTNLQKEAKKIAAKPKVLVCGLLPIQAEEISKEFSELLSFTFVASDQNMSVLKSNVSHVDSIIMMTKFISHSHSAIVAKYKNVININGGVSALKHKLTEMACNY